MRKSPSQRIITKNSSPVFWDWVLVALLAVSLFLRVFRLDSLTEFLGDQGRTMLILYDWMHRGVFPLAGPTTLSGHHLGPFFYYLLLPGYVFGSGGPVGVSLWVALLGVFATYMLYKAVYSIYGRLPALAVSALYAVSPAIVTQDRIIWEPNLVPFFAIMFAWLFIQQHHRVSFRRVMAQGAVCGVLVQLHYPNLFFLALLAIVSFGHSVRMRDWGYIPRATLGWCLGFFAVLSPFLFYEYTHGFSDIRGIADVIVSSGSTMGKRETLLHAWDYMTRVVGKMLPGMGAPLVLVLFSGWIVFLVGHFTGWNMFWTVWFVFGVLAMARYSGVVYDHYLNFLIPVPFFMAGSVLASVRGRLWRIAAYAGVAAVCIMQLMRTDIFAPGVRDIGRTDAAVRSMREYIGGQPFSFTLTGSRSFSDLHYRYYMRVYGLHPSAVSDRSYATFMLVCDGNTCPSAASVLSGPDELPVMCYDEHCSGSYPVVRLAKEWKYRTGMAVSEHPAIGGRIYVFDRR